MTGGLTIAEINALFDQMREATSRATRYALKAEQYREASAEAHKESLDLQARLSKLAAGSQHEVEVVLVNETQHALPADASDTPLLPTKRST